MDEVETRKNLIEKAIEIGISENLLKNLNSRSIKKILDYDEELKREENAFREVPGYRA